MPYIQSEFDEVASEIYREMMRENSDKTLIQVIAEKYGIPEDSLTILSGLIVEFIGNQLEQNENLKIVLTYIMELSPYALTVMKSANFVSLVFSFAGETNESGNESNQSEIHKSMENLQTPYSLN